MQSKEIIDNVKDMQDLFRKDPNFFSERVSGTRLWGSRDRGQIRIMESLRDHSKTAVKSCNGAGKSRLAAEAAAWYLISHYPAKVITTAPTFTQVKNVLWKEIAALKRRAKENNFAIGGELNQTEWKLNEEWWALGISTNEADRFQGFHSEHLMGIFDEGSGVAKPIWDAMNGLLPEKWLVIGNPLSPLGPYYDCFLDSNKIWNKITISAFDTPNFTLFDITIDDIRNDTWRQKITGPLPYPALVTPQWVAERWLEWGEDSPLWHSRVQGEFPQEGDDTLIGLTWIMKGKHNISATSKGMFVGVDVARYGSCETVITIYNGYKLIDQVIMHKRGIPDVFDRICHELKERDCVTAPVAVDDVGVGGGVTDLLKRQRYNVIPVVAQARAENPEKFADLRSEIYWTLREHFMKELISGIGDETLITQLAGLKVEYVNGKIHLMSKDKMMKEGYASPDRADSLALAHYASLARAFVGGKVKDTKHMAKW
jgi:phage terminase large subunit